VKLVGIVTLMLPLELSPMARLEIDRIPVSSESLEFIKLSPDKR
jgi:hypothetical protein